MKKKNIKLRRSARVFSLAFRLGRISQPNVPCLLQPQEVSVATQVNMLETKSQLSKLVKAVLAGEDVIIARNGVPMVRLVPVRAPRRTRNPGAWATLPEAAPDWDSSEFNRTLAKDFVGKPES